MIEVVAMLPWWAGVLLAFIAYFILHHYASAEVVQSASVAQLGVNIASQLGKTLAMFGQYLLPLAFLIGAGISAYGRHRRNELFADIQKGSSPSELNGMTWREFEMLVGEAFRCRGYTNYPPCRWIVPIA
jgi:restriction system protein